MSLKSVKKTAKDIKEMKIKGATPIALAAIKSLRTLKKFSDLKKAISLLKSARPNEPLLFNGLKLIKKQSKNLSQLKETVEIYIDLIEFTTVSAVENASKLIKNKMTIMTHCGSSAVQNAIILAHLKGKKIKVINTETRPVYQGRTTAQKLAKAGIKVTHITDSAAATFMPQASLILVGADIIGKDYFVNKTGTLMYAKLAKQYKKKMYSVAQLLKFSDKKLKIEQRDAKQIWNVKNKNIKIENPAFDSIPLKEITGVVTELGIIKKDFKKHVKNLYPWII